MTVKVRSALIDLTRDLPARARPVAAGAMAKVFGGCIGGWQDCTQNYQCCSYQCAYRIWLSQERTYKYQCLPPGAGR
jgi:hypothetical protein